jgi:protein-tyrosine phosphatase
VGAGWFDLDRFDLDVYSELDDPRLYDSHQVCPKFVAFRGPDVRDNRLNQPAELSGLFKTIGVTAVVRLNEVETYPREHFLREGIRHYELEFPDCSLPERHIVERFLAACDTEVGVVAVHCRAGLGRTGTLIALWMMREGWRARAAIAWLRVVRSGSVLGIQQNYLEAVEAGSTWASREGWGDLDEKHLEAGWLPGRICRLGLDLDVQALEQSYHRVIDASLGNEVMQSVFLRQNWLSGGSSGGGTPLAVGTPVSTADRNIACPVAGMVEDDVLEIKWGNAHSKYMRRIIKCGFHPIFLMMTEASRAACLSCVKYRTYKRSSVIVKRGDIGNELFLIKSGVVHCILTASEEGSVVQELQAGSYFGEIAFLGNALHKLHWKGSVTRRTCDVVASSDVELLQASTQPLTPALSPYNPTSSSRTSSTCTLHLTYNPTSSSRTSSTCTLHLTYNPTSSSRTSSTCTLHLTYNPTSSSRTSSTCTLHLTPALSPYNPTSSSRTSSTCTLHLTP